MFKVKIFNINKTKEKWLKDAILEYEKRLPFIEFNWLIFKDEKSLLKKLKLEKSYICLSEFAKPINSSEFSRDLMQLFENNKTLSFVIGSDIGLNKEIKNKASYLLSLSSLTFTHQMTRVILIEQIYRAFQIEKNTKYHK